jgi:hypothetical protein|tara:strand:+ start:6349 stop:7602 length:1254 start_codon:yes stop_codon:yes gene_type:complete
MTPNLKMMELVTSMLLEAELKDVFSTIKAGDKIGVTRLDGKNHIYQTQSNMTGKIIMKDLSKDSAGAMYVMDRTSLNGNDLTIHRYDNKQTNFKGEELKMDVSKFSILDDKTGSLENIDIENPKGAEDDFRNEENTSRVDEYNNLIKTLDKGDVLRITTESEGNEEGSDTIINDLFFDTIGIREEWYVFKLKDINADAEGEKSIATQKLVDAIKNQNIFVGKEGFFKVINDTVTLNLKFGKKFKVTLKGIIDVEINNIEADIDPDDEDGKYSKKELEDYLMNNKDFQDMLQKQPNLMGKLSGASPKGLMQLKNMIQNYSTKNSYLTKGKNIKFKLITKDITVDLKYKLLNKKGTYYEAKVIDENTLKLGIIGRGHWEINLKKEIEDNTYQAEVNFCKADRSCKLMTKEAIIKILTNG